jgi:hypothetical protein
MEWIESLALPVAHWREAAVGAGVALAVALAARTLHRPLLGAAAAGIGVLAGWWFAFGLLTASPRQLPERLPLLLLMLVLTAPLMGAAARRWRWLALPLAGLGALAAGWWMAGAPLWLPDLARAAPVLAGVAAATFLLVLRAGPRWAGPVAAAVLLAGLHLAPLVGPFRMLGLVLLAATTAAALVPPGKGGAAHPALGALPVAGALAALAAIPLVARGAAADVAVAAAPLAALAVGAPLGARLIGGRRASLGAVAGAVLAGGFCAGVAFLLR